MKVCLDAGHGGSDPGAIGIRPFRLEERQFNLGLSLLLEDELESRGHWVVMTRRQDRTLSLHARAGFANRLEADLFVSVHANAGNPSAEGMEVFHFAGSASGGRAAQQILDAMMAAFPNHRRRGVKEANFSVLRETRMTAVLVECEFLTNPRQLRFLASRANQRKLVQAIAGGIDLVAADVG